MGEVGKEARDGKGGGHCRDGQNSEKGLFVTNYRSASSGSAAKEKLHWLRIVIRERGEIG